MHAGMSHLSTDPVHAGWFNLLGQIAITASIVFSMANHVAAMILLATGGAGTGYVLTEPQLLAVYAGGASTLTQDVLAQACCPPAASRLLLRAARTHPVLQLYHDAIAEWRYAILHTGQHLESILAGRSVLIGPHQLNALSLQHVGVLHMRAHMLRGAPMLQLSWWRMAF